MQPTRGATRAARAGILGTVTLLLALTGHLLGGGALPSPGVALAAVGGVALATHVMTARRLRLVPLLLVVGALQLVLHLALGLGGAHACAPMPMTHASHVALTCTTGSPSMLDHASPLSPMLAGHLVATLLTVWLLARGEAVVWSLADRVVAATVIIATASLPQAVRLAARPVLSPLTAVLVGPAAPRGPPLPTTS